MSPEPARPRILPLADDRTPPSLNIFRTLKRNRPLFKAFLTLGMHLLNDGSIPDREREIIILRIGWRSGSEYEFSQHTRIGRDAGLTDGEIGWLAGQGEPNWSADDQDLVELADELCADDTVSQSTWDALTARWSEEQLLELLVLAGFYRLVSGMLNSAGIALEPGSSGWPAGVDLPRAPRDQDG